jgi:O-antigen/teichoic acid export membrane protein|tara:strand:+ start:2182 stop:3426 length:1245 start_codon:yes stop_codon:yes gene_type:complete
MASEIFIRMVGIFSSRLITFLTSLYIASILSEGEWGRISLLMNYFIIFLVFAGNFFPRAVTTYTAQINSNTLKSNSALIIGNRIVLIASAVTTLCGIIFIKLFNPISDPKTESLLLLLLLIISVPVISQNIICYFQGLGKIGTMTILELIRSITTSALIIWGVKSMHIPSTGWVLGKVSGILIVLILLIIIYYIIQQATIFQWKNSDLQLYGKLKKYFYWGLLGAVFSVGIRNVDVIIISNTFNSDARTGLFKLSILFFTAFGLFGQSITSALHHRIAALGDNLPALKSFTFKIKLITIPIYCLVAVILFIYSGNIITFIFADKYMELGGILKIILIASIFQIYTFINGGVWACIGKMKMNSQYFGISSIMYIVILTVFIKQFDFYLFPYAILISSIFGAIYSEVLFRKLLIAK